MATSITSLTGRKVRKCADEIVTTLERTRVLTLGKEQNQVYIHCLLNRDVLQVEVIDEGKGIEDVEKAMEPMYTTKPDMDRSGMGFAFMEAFMDELEVISEPGQGTTVLMSKKLGTLPFIDREE